MVLKSSLNSLQLYDDDSQPAPELVAVNLPGVSAAPVAEEVGVIEALATREKCLQPLGKNFNTNTTADIMFAPIQGPLQPHQTWGGLDHAYEKNTMSGKVEKCIINDAAFDLQRYEFQRKGHAENPSSFMKPSVSHRTLEPVPTGDQAISTSRSLANQPYHIAQSEAYPNTEQLSRKQRKLKRRDAGDPSTDSYLGPWAPPVAEEERRAELEALAKNQQVLYEEAKAAFETEEEKKKDIAAKNVKQKITSIFHGKSQKNFQGLSWIDKPLSYQEPDEDIVNFLPKKLVHSYVGHTMGVQAVRFFPDSGHLLLSASLDSQCKIWDVHNDRKCLRSYMGHNMAIRDAHFTDGGKKFYSCSLDTHIILWDTEYGKIIGTFSNEMTPYCLAVHPSRSLGHVFIIGCNNKKAVQFDARNGEITQEYSEHLASVNTVTFCENGEKLITTADDKKMFVWEFGIPVVVKHVAQSHMHSMPAVSLHPSQKFISCQSMDNQIVVYEATGRFRFQGQKRFRGHSSSGYAIRPGFSIDGRFLMSGDVSGKVWFWDWKSLKNIRTLQAHDRVCLGTEWHPVHPSKVGQKNKTLFFQMATCGWDGLVKLWE